MLPIADILTEAMIRTATAAFGELPSPLEPVVATQDQRHGDYQSNLAFRLAKVLRRAPRELAAALASSWQPHPLVDRVEIAGQGFVNLTLNAAGLARFLEEQAEDPELAVPQSGQGRRIVIDYGSPNVAKRMHVGHLRSTNIGHAIVGLHRAAGWETIGDNHLGDWGTQFGKLIVAWRLWADTRAFEEDAIGELQRLYELFGQESESSPSLQDDARLAVARLQEGEPESRALWRRFVEASMREFDAVYARMGIRFDHCLGESFYEPWLQPLVDELLESGIAEVDDGAALIRFSDQDGPNLSSTPLLIRKRDGAALYGTTDLAALRYREQSFHPDRVLYVTDSRQQLHFKQIFAASRRIGLSSAELVHVGFGVISLPEGAMSSRKGTVIRLVELLDEAVRRARAVVDEKSPDIPDQERAEIAEAVGVSAVRYADLSQNPSSNVVFEWDRMLSLDGNTAPFLLYSYARCRSLQRKAGLAAGERAPVQGLVLEHPLERELGLAIARFPEAHRAALASYRPNMLCDYLFGLAGSFNRFYYELPVLRSSEQEKLQRLALVEATARVLSRGLAILGLPCLDRM